MLTVYSLNPDKRLAVTIAIFFAEDVLPIWEMKYPEDIRPRKAIEAAKAWLTNPCEETATAAGVASHAALDSYSKAVDTYTSKNPWSAGRFANAAFAALNTANAAATSAAYATNASTDASHAAADAGTERARASTDELSFYIHSKLVRLLPHIFEYKIFTKTSFEDPEQVFNLLSEKNQHRFLFNLSHLR